MGCSQSAYNVIIEPNSAGLPQENSKFTRAEIELIRSSWKLIEDKKEFGILVMTKAFLEHPEIQERWIFARDIRTPEEVRNHPQLVYHATKIANVLNKSILAIENLEEAPYFLGLKKLGKNHYSYGVKLSDFQPFEDALLFCLRNHLQNTHSPLTIELEDVYKKLFLKIARKMGEGIQAAQLDELKESQKSHLGVKKIVPL